MYKQSHKLIPPWPKSGQRIESLVRKALYDYEMVKEVDHVAVALSGGKDSLTLLTHLKAISGRGFPAFNLSAIHISGAFTCGAGVNLSYLHEICRLLDVPLKTTESQQTIETLECYTCSRERRRLLFEEAKKIGASTIAFGHHRDDNAQTLMMNLLQKGEFAGILPKIEMKRFGVTIIRPLTYLSEQSIRSFAQEQGFLRVMCQCPVGQRSMRKKVGDLLLEMEELYPNARHNLSLASLNYGSDKAARE